MTGPEHYQEAERLLDETLSDVGGQVAYNHANVIMASVHATLALAAATGLHEDRPAPDYEAWQYVTRVQT